MQFPITKLNCTEPEPIALEAAEAKTLMLDEDMLLWMAMEKPANCPASVTLPFDVVLNYYSQLLPFDMDILGEARIVTELSSIPAKAAAAYEAFKAGFLVLTVKIIDIDYYEQKPGLLTRLAKKISSLFASGGSGMQQAPSN